MKLNNTIKNTVLAASAAAVLTTWCASKNSLTLDKSTKIDNTKCYLRSKIWDLVEQIELPWVKKEDCAEYNKWSRQTFEEQFIDDNKTYNYFAKKLVEFHWDKLRKKDISEEDFNKIIENSDLDWLYEIWKNTELKTWFYHKVLDLAWRYKESADDLWIFEIKITENDYKDAFVKYIADKNVKNKVYDLEDFKELDKDVIEKYIDPKKIVKKEIIKDELELSENEYNLAYTAYYFKTKKSVDDFKNLSNWEKRKYLKEKNNTKKINQKSITTEDENKKDESVTNDNDNFYTTDLSWDIEID